MPGKQDDATISQAYREHRPYLVDLAFRMLGDLGAAEDVVQDAFARLLRADAGEIDDERGWLIVVTSRLALDQIRSARSRRERAHDPGGAGGLRAARRLPDAVRHDRPDRWPAHRDLPAAGEAGQEENRRRSARCPLRR